MATKMIFVCSTCAAVFDINDTEGMEAHIDANTDHTVSESYVYMGGV
jgi:Fe2+ or Zn2+ uptake regulation protein